MIAAQAQRHHFARIELAILDQHTLLGSADAKDGDLRIVDDGCGEQSAQAPGITDRERPTDELFARDRPITAALGQVSYRAINLRDTERIGIGDDRDHQAMFGVDSDSEVRHILDEDLLLLVVNVGVERWMILERSTHRNHNEGQETELCTHDGCILMSLGVEGGNIRFIHDRKVNRSSDRTAQCFSDFATNATERNALSDAVSGDRRWGRGRSNGHTRCCLRAASGVGVKIANRHAPASTCPGNSIDIDPKLARYAPHGRRRQRFAGTVTDVLLMLTTGQAIGDDQRGVY